MDPRKKDLCIYDPDGLAQQSGIEQVTGLSVHFVNIGEIDLKSNPERRIARNKGAYHIVDQSGIWVHQGTNPKKGWGEAGPGYDKNGPPRTAIPWVIIDAARVRRSLTTFAQTHSAQIKARLGFKGLSPDAAWLEGHIAAALRWITVHETCHALSINHHSESPYFTTPFAGDGGDEATRGDRSCVMRYLAEAENGDASEGELMEILCGAGGWPGALCAKNHDCKKQMVVTDKGE
jgi:hypothetical protein